RLVNACIRSTLLDDRVFEAHDHGVARQITAVAQAWDADRADQVAQLQALLASEAAAAIAALRQLAPGVTWLLDRWGFLEQRLSAQGCWTPEEAVEAIQLDGGSSRLDRLPEHERSYLILLYNAQAQPEPDRGIL